MNRNSKKSHITVAIILFVIAAVFLCYGIYVINYSIEYIRTYMEISTISFDDAFQYVVSSAASYIGFAIVIATGGFIVFSLRKTYFVTFCQSVRDEDDEEDDEDRRGEEEREKEAPEEEEEGETSSLTYGVGETTAPETTDETSTEKTPEATDMPPVTKSAEEAVPPAPVAPAEPERRSEGKAPEKESDLIHTREFSLPKKPAITYEEVTTPQGDASAQQTATAEPTPSRPPEASGPATQPAVQQSAKPKTQAVAQQQAASARPQLDTDSWLKDFFASN